MWQAIDGHSWVIYTAKAALIPLISEAGGDAELEETGFDHSTTEQRAFAHMIVDCRDQLQRRIDDYEPAD